MGLDLTEMMLDIEDQFGFEITEEEAQKAHTVGDVYELVLKYLGPERLTADEELDQNSCDSFRLFLRIRTALSKLLLIKRRSIKLDADLRKIIPAENRKRVLSELKEKVGLVYLPDIWIHPFLSIPLFIALLVAFIFMSTGVPGIDGYPKLAGVLMFVVVCAILIFCGNLFAWYIPKNIRTVRQIIQRNTLRDGLPCDAILPPISGVLTRKQVWTHVCLIISDQLDIELDRLTKDSHFMKDLGID